MVQQRVRRVGGAVEPAGQRCPVTAEADELEVDGSAFVGVRQPFEEQQGKAVGHAKEVGDRPVGGDRLDGQRRRAERQAEFPLRAVRRRRAAPGPSPAGAAPRPPAGSWRPGAAATRPGYAVLVRHGFLSPGYQRWSLSWPEYSGALVTHAGGWNCALVTPVSPCGGVPLTWGNGLLPGRIATSAAAQRACGHHRRGARAQAPAVGQGPCDRGRYRDVARDRGRVPPPAEAAARHEHDAYAGRGNAPTTITSRGWQGPAMSPPGRTKASHGARRHGISGVAGGALPAAH